MKYFFETRTAVERLHQVLLEWKGTPFAHNSGIKKEGVDCSHLITCVLTEIGARGKIFVPKYVPDWYKHKEDDRFIKGIEALGGDWVSTDNPKNGDIILLQLGRSVAHGGFFLYDNFWHVMWGGRVGPERWDLPKIHKRRRYGFRIWADQK